MLNCCPIKAEKKTAHFFSFKNFPLQTTPINKKKITYLYKNFSRKKLFTNLHYNYCKNCDHIFLKNPPKQKIMNFLYKNFYSYPSPLLTKTNPQRDNFFLQIFNKFFHTVLKKNKNQNLLEVGCYDGYILSKLNKNYNVHGVDPSKGALIGKKFGLNIKRDFFSFAKFKKSVGKYNVILARHFLEHLINPSIFLNDCNKILSSSGYIIIEVPNVTHYLKVGSVEIFSPQHIQCFSRMSLTKMLLKSGFSVKKIIEKNGNLIVLAKKNIKEKKILIKNSLELVKKFKEKFLILENNLKKIIEKKSTNSQILLWGAGSFCSSFLVTFDINLDSIRYVVDSDETKSKLKFVNFNLKIISKKIAKKMKPKTIIITSYYSSDIIKTIKKMNLKCNVVTIFPKFKHLLLK